MADDPPQTLRPPAEALLVMTPTAELATVVEAIALVHDFPATVTPVAIRIDPGLGFPGQYRFDPAGVPTRILLSPKSPEVPLVALHEIATTSITTRCR